MKMLVVGPLALAIVCPTEIMAQEGLPDPMVLSAPNQIPTLDGGGNHIGRLKNFVLTMSRQYTPENQMITPWHLDYFFGNGNAGETWRGSQYFTIDLVDGDGKTVVQDVIGHVAIPRGRCWYSGGSPQGASGTTPFDYTNKNITSMKITVGPLSGTQTGC